MNIDRIRLELGQFAHHGVGPLGFRFRNHYVRESLEEIVLPLNPPAEAAVEPRPGSRFAKYHLQIHARICCDAAIHGAKVLYRMGNNYGHAAACGLQLIREGKRTSHSLLYNDTTD